MMFILSFFLKSDDSFLCCIFSCCLCNNCFVNETESGYSDERKSEWIALDQITYDIFFTTLGSWEEKTVQCRNEQEEDGIIHVECSTGVITSVQAFLWF